MITINDAKIKGTFKYYGDIYKIKNIEYPAGKGGYSFGRFITSTHDDEFDSFSAEPSGMQIYQDINNPKVGYRIYKGLPLALNNFYFPDGLGDINFISKLQERQESVKLTQFPTGIVTINDCIIGHEIPFYENFSSLDKFILDNKNNPNITKEVLTIYKNVIIALLELEQNGIYYLDIHKKNFLVDNNDFNNIKIIDFQGNYLSFDFIGKSTQELTLDHLKKMLIELNKILGIDYNFESFESFEDAYEKVLKMGL